MGGQTSSERLVAWSKAFDKNESEKSLTKSSYWLRVVPSCSHSSEVVSAVARGDVGKLKQLNKLRAPWQSDWDAKWCTSSCGTEFSISGDSRHHCRGCGFVVCGRCSRADATGLPGYSPKEAQRVCRHCEEHPKHVGGVNVSAYYYVKWPETGIEVPSRILNYAIACNQPDVVHWLVQEKGASCSSRALNITVSREVLKRGREYGIQEGHARCLPPAVLQPLIRGDIDTAMFLARKGGSLDKADSLHELIPGIPLGSLDKDSLKVFLKAAHNYTSPYGMALCTHALARIVDSLNTFMCGQCESVGKKHKDCEACGEERVLSICQELMSFLDKEKMPLRLGQSTCGYYPWPRTRLARFPRHMQCWLIHRMIQSGGQDWGGVIAHAITTKDEESLRALLEYTSPDSQKAEDGEGETMMKGYLPTNYNYLIDKNQPKERTLLHEAAKCDLPWVVSVLLERGASPYARESDLAMRPIDMAGSPEVTAILKDWMERDKENSVDADNVGEHVNVNVTCKKCKGEGRTREKVQKSRLVPGPGYWMNGVYYSTSRLEFYTDYEWRQCKECKGSRKVKIRVKN